MKHLKKFESQNNGWFVIDEDEYQRYHRNLNLVDMTEEEAQQIEKAASVAGVKHFEYDIYAETVPDIFVVDREWQPYAKSVWFGFGDISPVFRRRYMKINKMDDDWWLATLNGRNLNKSDKEREDFFCFYACSELEAVIDLIKHVTSYSD